MGSFRGLPQASSSQLGIAQLGEGVVNLAGNIKLIRPALQVWVDFRGDDALGDGSPGNPWRTLGQAYVFATSNPGTTIYLPGGTWSEDIGIPPTGTSLVGHGGVLQSSTAGNLTWTEGSGSSTLCYLENLVVKANISGKNVGNLSLIFKDCSVFGTHTLVGFDVFIGCNNYPTFVNCPAVRISADSSASPPNLALAYDPVSGTNGSIVGHRVQGEFWGTISYTATDPGSELTLIGLFCNQVNSIGSAVIRCRNSIVLQTLSTDSGGLGLIEYDSPLVGEKPTFAGAGVFKLCEFALHRSESMNAGEHDISIAIPRLPAGTQIQNIFFSTNLNGVDLNLVSNTDTSITVHTKPPASNPAYIISMLVRP
jgi:hypothetical protein